MGAFERSWRELAVLTAEQSAHGAGESLGLVRLLLEYEALLRDRHPELKDRWDDLLIWESTLIHVGDGPASDCVTCRRARRELAASALPT